MKRRLLFMFMVLVYFTANAQDSNVRPYRYFATQQMQKLLLEQQPEVSVNLEDMEQLVQSYGTFGNDRLDQVPIVFHILYKEGQFFPSSELVLAQVELLNQAYGTISQPTTVEYMLPAMQEFAEMSVTPGISFCLYGSTPDNLSTVGINYIATDVEAWPLDNSMKSSLTHGADAWDSDHILNIWVCNLKGFEAGFAQLPGGPDATDGIVVDYDYITGFSQAAEYPYSSGKTLVHLVGSYLGLYELWNENEPCGDDKVADTPIHNAPNFATSDDLHHVSLCESPEGKPEMVINYMDNTDDHALTMFTQGQKNRLKAILSELGPRHGITMGCTALGLKAGTVSRPTAHGVAQGPSPSMLVFPNPTSGLFSVKVVGGKHGWSRLEVHNILGSLLWQGEFDLDSEYHLSTVNGQGWLPGLYNISIIMSDGTIISQKLDFQHP